MVQHARTGPSDRSAGRAATSASARQAGAVRSRRREAPAVAATREALDPSARGRALARLRATLNQGRRVTRLAQLSSRLQRKPISSHPVATIQRAVGFEFEDDSWSTWATQPGKDYRPFFSGSPAARPTSKSAFPGANIYDKSGSDHVNDLVGRYNLESAGKKGTLHQGPHYKIEPDGPAEIVAASIRGGSGSRAAWHACRRAVGSPLQLQPVRVAAR